MSFLVKHKLFYNTLIGVRPNHSCETVLIHMVDYWLKALDKGKLVGVIFIDFCKAFDPVDHDILLKKVELYHISQNSVNWYRSYLTNRKQKVSFNNTYSDLGHIKYGVPQGSILGPLISSLY